MSNVIQSKSPPKIALKLIKPIIDDNISIISDSTAKTKIDDHILSSNVIQSKSPPKIALKLIKPIIDDNISIISDSMAKTKIDDQILSSNINYSEECLLEQFTIHKTYILARLHASKTCNINFRLPAIPEDITENIIKFIIINKENDHSCIWSNTGDLLSKKFGVIECKSFTSAGPSSFSPTSDWNVIYFLDARNWLNDKFILYKINLAKTSDKWKNIKVNKFQTFNDQCIEKRRPRLDWKSIYSQLNSECIKVFEGGLESIFV